MDNSQFKKQKESLKKLLMKRRNKMSFGMINTMNTLELDIKDTKDKKYKKFIYKLKDKNGGVYIAVFPKVNIKPYIHIENTSQFDIKPPKMEITHSVSAMDSCKSEGFGHISLINEPIEIMKAIAELKDNPDKIFKDEDGYILRVDEDGILVHEHECSNETFAINLNTDRLWREVYD